MIIRKYRPSDRPSCLQIFNSNRPVFFAPHELEEFKEWLDGQDPLKTSSSGWQREYYFVVEEEQKIIACGGFYLPEKELAATMVWGMVENSLHKKGVGKKLLAYRIRQIRLLKPDAIILLDTTQYSYQFFEKFGFIVTKVSKDYYDKGLDRYDMVG